MPVRYEGNGSQARASLSRHTYNFQFKQAQLRELLAVGPCTCRFEVCVTVQVPQVGSTDLPPLYLHHASTCAVWVEEVQEISLEIADHCVSMVTK